MTSIMLDNVLGLDGVSPFDGFGEQELALVSLDPIRSDHGAQDSQEFSSFC
jgi:hypothetical protein